ncbi:ureidoglycolate hydrolase-domain-containing protein [Apodospora peruviana]|uniref:Ureidoglycolate hydrolase-domain-containing protein n=1 Tax=Apodospora peruviana TaxID=516989 RepID=A0AAE0I131_9PEZI|nr:ureidoglycolate hydrolase-domain-containing protein [Apodospora peruviana]
MASPLKIQLGDSIVIVDAVPLDRNLFAPFGHVVENPRPDLHPSAADPNRASDLPFEAVVANQGSAIKYQHVSRMVNLYDQAPSGRPGVAVMNMFVCAARKLVRSSEHMLGREPSPAESDRQLFPVSVLERHPYTTQTFTPLAADPGKRFLVIVAPSLPPSTADQALPYPASQSLSGRARGRGRGRGLPDVRRLRAFVATAKQAVTYGAGTWHAPMVALGPVDTALDFLVVQFVNGEAIEDCQEVFLAALPFLSTIHSNPTMAPALESTDARNKLEDLSGIEIKPGKNPYHALIEACHGKPAEIQSLYATHRVTRNALQREKFLSPDFKELVIDPFLLRLENPEIEPGFQDPRNCLVFWARPPDHIVNLASHLQTLLRKAAPDLWLMPPQRMHLTTLELAHSRTPDEIASLISCMRPALPALTSFTYAHRSRLVKPLLSYDLSAIAMSFLPAAGERVLSPTPVPPHPREIDHPGIPSGNVSDTDSYTYHHLRRDVFDLAQATSVSIGSRYVVPSAHITLGRYLTQKDHKTPELREAWIQAIEDINQWLETEVWDAAEGEFIGEWIVGQERGLDARNGALWYGGGRTIMGGEGF